MSNEEEDDDEDRLFSWHKESGAGITLPAFMHAGVNIILD
jgi:hypothetical protein